MKQQPNLSELSLEALEAKAKTLRKGIGVLIGLLIVLFITSLALFMQKKGSPVIAVPLALLPVVFMSKKNLDAIESEVKKRKSPPAAQ